MSLRTAHYLTLGLATLNTVTTPFQYLLEYGKNSEDLCLTHKICNAQALFHLKEQETCANLFLLENNFPALQAGVVWADLEFKNINHFFDPTTQKGLWRFSPARYSFVIYLTKASRLAKKEDFTHAFFYLGAAAHLLQDMTVPHHVCGHLFNGHKKFENWVQTHIKEFTLQLPDIPHTKPLDLMLYSAQTAYPYMFMVDETATDCAYAKAAQELLPIAQSSTTALFKWFLETKIQLCR